MIAVSHKQRTVTAGSPSYEKELTGYIDVLGFDAGVNQLLLIPIPKSAILCIHFQKYGVLYWAAEEAGDKILQ
jgi:hypothetical protein